MTDLSFHTNVSHFGHAREAAERHSHGALGLNAEEMNETCFVAHRLHGSLVKRRTPAGWQPAKQQVGNLRYSGGATVLFIKGFAWLFLRRTAPVQNLAE